VSLFRQGRRVPLNVYEGDEPCFQAHSPEDAARFVHLLNLGQQTFDRALAAERPQPAGEYVPAPVPEDELVDLMGELERSVADAKASREARRAQLVADYDGLCVAEGCLFPHLTAWDDGEGPLLLCEHHGDELAVGFPLKPGAREVSR